MVQYLGVILLAAWAFNVWAFLTVFEARPGPIRLVLWAVILLVPVIGYVAWYLLGPRPGRA